MAPTGSGCTAIFLAAQQGHAQLVRFFLDQVRPTHTPLTRCTSGSASSQSCDRC
jgi:hypothetical protein